MVLRVRHKKVWDHKPLKMLKIPVINGINLFCDKHMYFAKMGFAVLYLAVPHKAHKQ